MIRAVLFDLDGVVRRFDPAHVSEIERRHGIPEGEIERFAFEPALVEQVTTGRMRRSEWIERIAEHLGQTEPAVEWGSQPFRVDPEVLGVADDLRALGVVTAILTNGTDTIPEETAALGLLARFDPIFNSATIGYIKPDVRAFAHAMVGLGLRGQEIFFVDDSSSKLTGAAALGMATHHFVGVPQLQEALRAHGLAVG